MSTKNSHKNSNDKSNLFKIEIVLPRNFKNLESAGQTPRKKKINQSNNHQVVNKNNQSLFKKIVTNQHSFRVHSSASCHQKQYFPFENVPPTNKQSSTHLFKTNKLKKLTKFHNTTNLPYHPQINQSSSEITRQIRSAHMQRQRKRSWQQLKIRYPMIQLKQFMFSNVDNEGQLQQKNQYKVFCSRSLKFKKLIHKIQKDICFQPIRHENIINIQGRVKIHNKVYFIQDCFQNNYLSQLIKRYQLPFMESFLKEKILSLVSAMICLHQRNIIHHRILPHNVVLDKNGNLLIDLLASSQGLLKQSEKMKYFYFLSPELLLDRQTNDKTDVWALGCLVLYMCTGNLQNSKLHPYNQCYNRSNSIEQLKIIKELRVKYGKPNTQNNQEFEQENQLSDQIKSFITHCLKITPKRRLKMLELNFNLPFLQQ